MVVQLGCLLHELELSLCVLLVQHLTGWSDLYVVSRVIKAFSVPRLGYYVPVCAGWSQCSHFVIQAGY